MGGQDTRAASRPPSNAVSGSPGAEVARSRVGDAARLLPADGTVHPSLRHALVPANLRQLRDRSLHHDHLLFLLQNLLQLSVSAVPARRNTRSVGGNRELEGRVSQSKKPSAKRGRTVLPLARDSTTTIDLAALDRDLQIVLRVYQYYFGSSIIPPLQLYRNLLHERREY